MICCIPIWYPSLTSLMDRFVGNKCTFLLNGFNCDNVYGFFTHVFKIFVGLILMNLLHSGVILDKVNRFTYYGLILITFILKLKVFKYNEIFKFHANVKKL